MTLNINVYARSLWPSDNTRDASGNKWMYVGLMFIPTNKEARITQALTNTRYTENIINYDELDNEAKMNTARKWIKLLKDSNENQTSDYDFNITGINYSSLNMEVFGESEQSAAINTYSRFIRKKIKDTLNKHYGSDVIIKNIYHHDEPRFRQTQYFQNNTMLQLRHEGINTKSSIITLIDEDHRNGEENKTIMQLIQLLLHCTFALLHSLPEDEKKLEILSLYRPLLNALINNDAKSRWHNPKQQIEIYDNEGRINKTILMNESRQTRLDKFI